ncbi:hypothetical protein CTAYLR_003832 [Chrysophaeum taylorii]|uniref:Polysaccharide biosynthesis protein C-terminal domain-containing protein n=1 Tax=Chrysophaeum taylorii TaxID=2483200 RepID=A0AAD7UFV0_9STRA|nr:hypothetical protein CTAYLR_003832 [Chrysophaeum taylorii]
MMLFVVIVSVSALQAPPATVRRVPVRATISEEPTMGKLAAFTLTAIPVFIAPSLLSLIDTAIVGRHSSLELAAMGPACAVVDSISGLFVFVSVGATNAVSSAETLGIARTSASAGAVVATALGTLVGGALAVAASPARFAGPIAAPCAAYVRIRAVGMPAAVALMSAQASCLGAKDSESPARATLLASVVNVAGDLLLVPSMGIRGAAWATVFCQFAAAATCAKALAKNRLLEFPPKITKSELRKFFAFGGFMVVLLMKILTYNQAVALAAALGPASGAAHQVIYSLSRFCYTLGDTTGATAQAFLPPIIKDHNPEMVARVVGKICVTSCVVALASATTAIALPTLAPHFFTTDAAASAFSCTRLSSASRASSSPTETSPGS